MYVCGVSQGLRERALVFCEGLLGLSFPPWGFSILLSLPTPFFWLGGEGGAQHDVAADFYSSAKISKPAKWDEQRKNMDP